MDVKVEGAFPLHTTWIPVPSYYPCGNGALNNDESDISNVFEHVITDSIHRFQREKFSAYLLIVFVHKVIEVFTHSLEIVKVLCNKVVH